MYEEYYITLPGGFRLPVALAKDTVTSWETAPVRMEPEEAEAVMAVLGEKYLLSQIIAGTVQQRQWILTQAGDCFRMDCAFLCTEMIGRLKPEEIGETNE